MSSQNKKGAWVIPAEQVKEFMSGPINWDKLINDCLHEDKKTDKKKSEKKNKKSWSF